MHGDSDRPVVARGTLTTVEYAIAANGSIPAKGFVEALDKIGQRRMDTLFRRMADTGKIFNKEQFRQVDGKIYEFKRYQTRIGCFQVGSRWRLTHGFIKKRPDWPKREKDRAKRIMEEDLDRDAPARSKGRHGK